MRKGERLKEKTIKKEQIGKWLEKLGKDYEIWAPVKKNGLVLFHPIVAAKEVFLDFSNSIKTPKDLFFPQSEVLFSFPEEGVEKEGEIVLQKPRIIFAVRPCDAKSLALLDQVFDSEDYQDPYYVQRREGTLLLGMACTHPQQSCFCTSVKGGPFEKGHLDLMIADLGNGRFFMEALTQRGEDLMEKDDSLQDLQKEDRGKLAKIKEKAEEKVKSKLATKGLEKKLDKMFDSPLWDRVHQRCLGCGICTYLCSTCHCFALIDEKNKSGGVERIRNWDSCMFPEFTVEASGHNPRISNRERMRQRVMHKFNYFVKRYGETACVGCGRCIQNCPVNMDIREIIEEIENERSLPS